MCQGCERDQIKPKYSSMTEENDRRVSVFTYNPSFYYFDTVDGRVKSISELMPDPNDLYSWYSQHTRRQATRWEIAEVMTVFQRNLEERGFEILLLSRNFEDREKRCDLVERLLNTSEEGQQMQSMIIGFWDVIKGECETYGYNELCVDDVFEDEERGLTFYLRVGKPVWEKVEGVYEWTKPIKEVEKISYLERSDLYRLNVDSGNVDIYRGPDWHILRSDEYWDEVGSAEMPDASAPMLKGNDATLLSDLINLIM